MSSFGYSKRNFVGVFLFRHATSHASLMSSFLIWLNVEIVKRLIMFLRSVYTSSVLVKMSHLQLYPYNLWNAILLCLGGVTENTDAVCLINNGDPRVENGQTEHHFRDTKCTRHKGIIFRCDSVVHFRCGYSCGSELGMLTLTVEHNYICYYIIGVYNDIFGPICGPSSGCG